MIMHDIKLIMHIQVTFDIWVLEGESEGVICEDTQKGLIQNIMLHS